MGNRFRLKGFHRYKIPPVLKRETDPLRALIASLFGNGEQGAMFIPQPVVLGQQVLFQDAAGTVPVTADGDPVGRHSDSTESDLLATSAATDQTYGLDGTVPYVDHITGSLSVDLPDLGAAATRVVVTWEGFEYLEGQTIGGATTLPQVQYELVIYRDSPLTAGEKSAVEKLFDKTWLLSDSAWDDNGQWRDIAVWEDAA